MAAPAGGVHDRSPRREEPVVRRVVIVPAVVLGAVLLGACGSSGSSKGAGSGSSSGSANPYGGRSSKTSSSSSTGAATTGTGATADLTAEDFAFTPTSLSVAAGGGSVKFTNTGSVEHNFTVDGKGVSKDVEAGKSATVKVDLPAGTYQFHCRFHPTQMKGTLTVP
jgi:plastocyanin